MKRSIVALTMTAALLWGGAVLFFGIANAIWPSYAVALLQVVASIYPGYQPGGSLHSIVVGALYALLDGAVGGPLFGWLYNRFAAAGLA